MESTLTSDLLRLVGVIILVLANGFFVAAEFSLVSVRRTRIEELVRQGTPGSASVKRALEDPDPVVIFEHAQLYNLEGELADPAPAVDIAHSAVRRVGGDARSSAQAGGVPQPRRVQRKWASASWRYRRCPHT